MSEMELICSLCDGLGEMRWAKAKMRPETNVGGWQRGPANATGWDCDYYLRHCIVCDGTGFRPSGASVPSVPAANHKKEEGE